MADTAWEMGDRREAVRCLLIPLTGRKLLLPSVAVAEVLAYAVVKPASDAPEWFIGTMEWRSVHIPLISFEKLIGEPVSESSSRHRVAVFHTIGESEKGKDRQPFYGIAIQGIPHLIQLRESELTMLQTSSSDEPVLFRVEVQGQLAIIPNLALLEERLDSVDIP